MISLEPWDERDLTSFCAWVDIQIEKAEEEIQAFRENLDNHPYYAFEWAESAIEAAANLRAMSEVRNGLNGMMERGRDPEAIRHALHNIAMDRVMVKASWFSHSSSQTTNTLAGYLLAAHVSIANETQTAKITDDEVKALRMLRKSANLD